MSTAPRWRRAQALLTLLALVALPGWLGAARADSVDRLREFASRVQSGRASFTQTVTSVDGKKKRTSSGEFEFVRPNRFRFVYAKPFEQQIVGDGRKVWLYDVDLNQVTVRPMAQALRGTPAALLAGTALEHDFLLQAQPAADGLAWVLATPRAKDGPIQSLRVGFDGAALAALEIVDAFGQRSLLRFSGFEPNVRLPDELFRFTPPKGVDVIEQ
ncbi:MAG: outer membrane lipoprotein chaperone LolA [Ideonella sp.]|nr:outer membrane lipoprotein chaperone LolA [Ideonella sp.]MCC7456138.1 outer membrane lipoprotein chaperone LolA [Nitrospira sp.]